MSADADPGMPTREGARLVKEWLKAVERILLTLALLLPACGTEPTVANFVAVGAGAVSYDAGIADAGQP